MANQKKSYFTLDTRQGSVRLFVLFLALLLVCGLGARLISSAGTSVKISRVTLDARGGTIDADLYYPAGTSDSDQLPAVLVGHGGGVGNGVVKGFAEELARRGFVVLNVNAYGMGLSENPPSDEAGIGVEVYQRVGTPHGMLDAVEFVRTLKFVDQTRIGMVGHSLGSIRNSFAAMLDCGYLTLNDRLINILYETFGQSFTREEITQDADTLAAQRLNADQFAYYESLREECAQEYNTRIRSLCLLGYDPNDDQTLQMVTVEVAGHEVSRNCQVNVGVVTGQYDELYGGFYLNEANKTNWHTGAESPQLETWYSIDDVTQTCTALGQFYGVSVANDQTLLDAADQRTIRVCVQNPETHSKNFFSRASTTDMIHYMEETLNYNRGDLTDASTVPLDAFNTVFMWRELLNGIAMVLMVCALIAAAGVLVRGEFFAACVAGPATSTAPVNKKEYWLFGALSVVIGFASIWTVNNLFVPSLPFISVLPIQTWWLTALLIVLLAAGSAILLLLLWLKGKKSGDLSGFKRLNLLMKAGSVGKTVLLAVILLAVGYTTLMVTEYLFNEDYRLWMAVLTEMKVEYWQYIWRYTLVLLPFFLLIGASTNYLLRRDLPTWADTLITVVMNSAGVWLCCLVNYLIMVNTGAAWSSFISTYSVLFLVPITVYVTRKMFSVTNSIWLGALINSMLISWSMISANGYDINMVFISQNWLSTLFNI